MCLANLIGELREEFEDEIRSKKITWTEELTENQVFADRLSMLRAVRNLVENALKHGSQLSEICVGCVGDGHFHRIYVRDNGIGVRPEAKDRPFVKPPERGNTQRVHGSGLGLGIIKKIAEMHGGKVGVEIGVPQGTTFYLTIPKEPISHGE